MYDVHDLYDTCVGGEEATSSSACLNLIMIKKEKTHT